MIQPLQPQNYLQIFQLMNNEMVNLPGSVENKLDPLPDNVLACSFRLVPQNVNGKSAIKLIFYE